MLIGQYVECESHLERDTIKLKQVKSVKEVLLYEGNSKWADTWNKKGLEWTPGKEGDCSQNFFPPSQTSWVMHSYSNFHSSSPHTFIEWQTGVSRLTSFIYEKHLHGKFLWCNYCHFHLFWCALSVRNKSSYCSLATQILVWPRLRFDCLSLSDHSTKILKLTETMGNLSQIK